MSKTKKADIYWRIEDLKSNLKKPIILTSGGFAPPHLGHFLCIQEAAELFPEYELVVIVNGDGWLARKKGYVVMSAFERANMIAMISGVDHVLVWDDGSPTVENAIEILSPKIFAKGGDRDSPENIPEWNICQEIGCQVVFAVGGSKINSSTNLIDTILKHHKEEQV